ncbi:MAG: DUF2752 domain-containing protein [Patescibacteria group bacterium]|nr:DUF2752 domain-containing protein [Patescibacteria group bacterium]
MPNQHDARIVAAEITPLAGNPLPHHVRWPLAVGGVVLLCGLAIAAWAKPDPRGYGTHEHLGFGPCTFRVLFNRPCPSCGMTTSWCCMMRGDAFRAFHANAGGALLAAIAIPAAPWMLASAARGRWWLKPPSCGWIAFGASVVGIVTLTQWILRLAHVV